MYLHGVLRRGIPNIIFIFYFYENYILKGDLASQIKAARRNLFSESKILHWFVQLTLGLHYMHTNKVLHRDLKTQNVFMLGNGRLVLGDLGISKVLDGTMDFAQTCIGTPYCKTFCCVC